MRLYCIDELTQQDVTSITARLNEMELGAGLPGLFWLPVPTALLQDVQREHAECGPHCMALEVLDDSLRLELLVRARNKLRCECVAYASPELQRHMMDYVDSLLRELSIPL